MGWILLKNIHQIFFPRNNLPIKMIKNLDVFDHYKTEASIDLKIHFFASTVVLVKMIREDSSQKKPIITTHSQGLSQKSSDFNLV